MRIMMPSATMLLNLNDVHSIAAWMMILPLLGALVSGLFAKRIGRAGAHTATTSLVFISFLLSLYLALNLLPNHASSVMFFDWLDGCSIGVLLDPLSILMCVVVTMISFFVHVYSIGYMQGDPGYQRFFAYVSFFTFAMLALVLAPNLLQTFFGWEGVGVASYLLIGFWYTRPSAADGSLKAFLVNRFADIGLLLALAVVYSVYNHLDIAEISNSFELLNQSQLAIGQYQVSSVTFVAWCLLFAAMGKSAQIPLHVWLPESMEGPTPISALIHAATMVTAGIYLMCRMSFIMIHEPMVQYTLMCIGATGAFLLACVGCVQYDLKRVVAYSTLSQLGYMMAACGAGFYPLAIFHLITHACFKALLFLSSGAVIIGMHHEQDMRKMSGLRHHMPLTTFCFLMGSLALVAFPGFSGFYSKDAILMAVSYGSGWMSYTYVLLVASAGLSAVYIFRAFGLVFLGKYDNQKVASVPWTMKLPMLFLSLLSVCSGFLLYGLFLSHSSLGPWVAMPTDSMVILQKISNGFQAHLWQHMPFSSPFWLSILGIFIAIKFPRKISDVMGGFAGGMITSGFGFDYLLVKITRISKKLAYVCSWYDSQVIDKTFVMGVARLVKYVSLSWQARRQVQLNQNIFLMLLGLIVLFFVVIIII